MAGDLLGKLGEAFVILRADGSTLNEDLKKQKKELEKELSTWESSFKSIGKGLSVSVTAPLVALGVAAIAAGSEVKSALDDIRIKTGAVGQAQLDLQKSFKTVFASVPSAAADVASAMSLIYTRTGLTGTALEELTGKTLNLARLTKSDLNETLKTSQDLFSNWGVTARDQGANLDYLFNAAQKGGVSVNALMGSLTSSGAILRGFGFNLHESAALLSAMAKSGIDADKMMAGLRKAAASFAKEGVDLKTGLAATVEKIKELGPGLKSTTLAIEVFGAKVGTNIADAIAKGQFNVRQFVDELAKSPDTIDKAAKATDGFKEELILLKNQLTLALEPLGKKFLNIGIQATPMLESLARYVGKVADAFSSLSPTGQTVAVALGAAAAAAGPVTIVIGSMIGHVTTIIALMAKWAPILLNVTAMATGLGIAIAGIALYKIIQVASLLSDLEDQRKAASKDLAAQTAMDQRAIQIAFEKTGVTAISAGQAYKVLDAYSAGLAGRTIDLTHASNEVRTAFEKGTAAAKVHTAATDEQRRAQDAAAKAAILEAEKQKAAAKARQEAADEAKKLAEQLKSLTAQYSGKDAALNVAQLEIVLSRVGGVSKLTKDEAGQMFSVFDAGLSKIIALGGKVPPKLREIYNELFRVAKLPELNQKSMDIWTKSWEEGLKKQEDSLEKDLKIKNELFIKGLDGAIDFMHRAQRLTMTEQERMLDDAKIFKDEALKQIEPLKDQMPEIWEAARDSINKIYDGMVQDADTAATKTATAFGKKLGTTIGSAFQQGGGARQIGQSIGAGVGKEIGDSVGESLGKTVTKKLTASLGPKAGAVIGGVVSTVIPIVGTILGGLAGKFIGSLFDRGKEGREVQAAREDLIKQAGGIDELRKKADAAGVSLDKLMSTKKMKDFNAEVQKINDAFEQQRKKIEGINTAVSGVNTLASGLAARLGKIYQDAYDAAKKAAKDANKDISDDTEKSSKDTNDTITDFTVKGTEAQQAAWQRLAQFTAATFAAQVHETGDVIGALTTLGGAFDTLADLQHKFGFQADDATGKLLGIYKTVKDNADVFTSISGASQIMQGLGEAMLITGGIGTTFGQELAADFQELEDRGVDATTALALMQKPLQQLWQLQKDGKVTLDATTQAMLDQAEQQGIVGAQMKGVNEKILDVLLSIANALGATIPESVGKFARAVGGINVPTIDIHYRYRQDGSGPGGLSGGDGGSGTGGDGGSGEPDPLQFDKGGVGNFGGMGTLAVLHGPEAVIPLDRLEAMINGSSSGFDEKALASALVSAGLSGGGDITIAPSFNGTLANEMRSYVREQLLPMIISVLQDSGEVRSRLGAVLTPSTGA